MSIDTDRRCQCRSSIRYWHRSITCTFAGFIVVEMAQIPETGKKFESFDQVTQLLDQLKEANHPLRVYNSQSVDEYNKRREKAKSPLDPVDKKWQYTYYSLRCVHYGQARSRSKGIRPNQRHFAMDCPAKLTISYDRGAKCLVLRECLLQHNHRTSSEIMVHYPSSRRLNEVEKQRISEVLSLKPNN